MYTQSLDTDTESCG